MVYQKLGIQLPNSKKPWGMLGKFSSDLHPSLIWEPKLCSDTGIFCVLTRTVICGHPDFTFPSDGPKNGAGEEMRGGEEAR